MHGSFKMSIFASYKSSICDNLYIDRIQVSNLRRYYREHLPFRCYPPAHTYISSI